MQHDDQGKATPMGAGEGAAGQVQREKRVRLSREARIQHILAVSQRLFSTHAYDAIAIEDIAAEAGMSKGLLYHYFASKRDLYLATLHHVLAQMLQFTDLHPDLHAGLAETLSLFERYPGLAKMVLRAGIGVDAEVDALLTAYRQQQLARVYHGLGFSDSHPLVLLGLQGWLSLLEEVCMQWVLQPEVTREQVVLLLEQSLQAILSAATSAVPTPERAHLRLDGQSEGRQPLITAMDEQ
jgi:AcrR family transcriptional regulator